MTEKEQLQLGGLDHMKVAALMLPKVTDGFSFTEENDGPFPTIKDAEDFVAWLKLPRKLPLGREPDLAKFIHFGMVLGIVMSTLDRNEEVLEAALRLFEDAKSDGSISQSMRGEFPWAR
jgi:hypothetical protein